MNLKEGYETKVGTLVLPAGRLSYPNLFRPRAMKGESEDKAKYGCTILLPKDAKLDLAIKWVDEAIATRWGADAAKKARIKRPFLKSIEKVDDAELAEQFPVLVRTSGDRKPEIRFGNGDVCDEEDEVYPGRWARVSVRVYAWEHPASGKGVSFGLSNVQLLDHADRIGGGATKAEDEFSPVTAGGGETTASADSIFG